MICPNLTLVPFTRFSPYLSMATFARALLTELG